MSQNTIAVQVISTMMKHAILYIVLIGLTGSPLSADPQTSAKTVNSVTARAYADVNSVHAGQALNLAIVLEPEKDWHIYWRNPKGTGMPTEIRWAGPTGFEFGRTEFPIPEAKYDKELEEEAWILQGKSVFVTPVRVPASLGSAKEVAFKVSIDWLACKKQCIPGSAQLELVLPVVNAAAQAKPANVDIFKRAKLSFPVPTAKAEHLKISASLDKATVAPGDKFTAKLEVTMASRHHMQSHKPLIEDMIPAYIYLEPTDGLEFGEVKYPEGHVREDKLLGKLSEYEGKVEFVIPVEAAADANTSARWIRGLLQYQICNDSGTCYPPIHAEFEIPVRMKNGPAPAVAYQFTRPNVEAPSADTHASAPNPTIEPSAGNSVETKKSTTVAEEENAGLLARTVAGFTRAQEWLLGFGYRGALAVAFLGGFLLNLMPCVLPVISLKVLSFVRQAHEHRFRIFMLGLTYGAGILVFFGVLAFLYFKYGNGWGQLSQLPQVNIILAGVITAFALSLFGVFTVFTPRVINKLDEKVEGEGFLSAFSTGVLATLLGTSCTAPFLSAAIGAVSKYSAPQGAGIFMAAGLGMAFPYIVLSAHPAWLRFVPKPGNWMLVFEGLMGFALLGTVIWLLNPVRGQIGDYGVLLSLSFLVMVSLAVWIKGRIEWNHPVRKKFLLYAASFAIVLLGWAIPFRWHTTIDELIEEKVKLNELIVQGQLLQDLKRTQPDEIERLITINTVRDLDWKDGIPWQHYTRENALRDVQNGYTVFVDYTADWCATCKRNLFSVIEQPDVMSLMKEYKVIPYEADYTLKIPEITEDLERFERAGVPMYLVYSPNNANKPQMLAEFLTVEQVIEAIRAAGPSQPEVKTAAAR